MVPYNKYFYIDIYNIYYIVYIYKYELVSMPQTSAYNFITSNGAALLEWECEELARLKLLNEKSYEFFQNFKDHRQLFSAVPSSIIATTRFGENLSGEFFSRVNLGRNVHIGNNVNCIAHGGIEIGDNVSIEDDVQLLTVFHSVHPSQRLPIRVSPIRIEDGARIGKGALIVSSRRDGRPLVIGKDAQILAQAVVVGNVADRVTAGGAPAREMEPGAMLRNEFSTASAPHSLMPVISVPDVRKTFGAAIEVVTPVYVSGAQNISTDGFVLINRGCEICVDGRMRAGAFTLIAPKVKITVEKGAALDIGSNVWIAAGAVIHVKEGETVCIGDGALIAAGAYVDRDVEPNALIINKNEVKRIIAGDDYDTAVPEAWEISENCIRNPDLYRSVNEDIQQKLKNGTGLGEQIRQAQQKLEDSILPRPSHNVPALSYR